MISLRWLILVLLVGTLPVITRAQKRQSDPGFFLGSESYIRHYLVEPIKPPEYPAAALEAGIQGEVLIFVCFDKDGKFMEAKPLRSPHELLSAAVIKTIEKWKITPPAPLSPDSIYLSELRFIFSLKDGKGDVAEAPESEQLKPSKEYEKAKEEFIQKDKRHQEQNPG